MQVRSANSPFYTALTLRKAKTRRTVCRAFGTTHSLRAGLNEAVTSGPETAVPKTSEGGSSKAAKERYKPKINKGNMFETYTAYGITELLYRECSTQADYEIPQAKDEDAEIPKTADGEDMGIGGGWWHDGKLTHPELQ